MHNKAIIIKQVDYNTAIKITTKNINNVATKKENIETMIKIGGIGRSL